MKYNEIDRPSYSLDFAESIHEVSLITDISDYEKEQLRTAIQDMFYDVMHRKIKVIKTIRTLTQYRFGYKVKLKLAKELAEEFFTDDQYYGEQKNAEN